MRPAGVEAENRGRKRLHNPQLAQQLQIERELGWQKQNDQERARLYGERGYLGDVRLSNSCRRSLWLRDREKKERIEFPTKNHPPLALMMGSTSEAVEFIFWFYSIFWFIPPWRRR
jgi:hypothetical protein